MRGVLRAFCAGALLPWALVFCAQGAQAQRTPIADGIAWLEANQNASGLWGVEDGTAIRDAAVALDVLIALHGDSTVIARGLGAINSVPIVSTDYASRRAIANTRWAAAPAAVGQIADAQNEDGGWGYTSSYDSNVLDTSVALRALTAASYSGATEMSAGVSYLTSHQNADGGWAFAAGDSSRVFFTAHVLMVLAMLEDDHGGATEIQSGLDWLRSQARPDGGFGTGEASNPYETGLALAAMIRAAPTAAEIADAMTCLENSQLPDGSWEGDPYGTAIALVGLSHFAPDLAVSSSGIGLSDPTPADSDLVTISATVRNRGVVDAESTLVQVFDGHPGLGGIQIGDDSTIASLAADADTTIEVVWSTFGLAGDHELYLLADPQNLIPESEELNNTAVRPVYVSYPPDLLIESITFDPPEPDTLDSVIIQTTVRNVGENTAEYVSLQVWAGNPNDPLGGVAVPLLQPPYEIPSIDPGWAFTLNLHMGNYFDTEGGYAICASVDDENTIREVSEFNNWGCHDLWVGIQCRQIALEAELNLLAWPLQPPGTPTSLSVIGGIPNCTELDGWDRVLQSWVSAVDLGGGTIVGDDFPIELRNGFFARVTQAGQAEFCGTRVTEHGSTDLEGGFDLVSVPNEDACYTAYTMIADIDSCVEARSWDSGVQGWEIAEKVAEDEFIGPDFPVVPCGGYFVRLTADAQWTTHTCDTLTVLPDLLVTPDDIALFPNPVPSGETVGIFVNINNIGLETAYSPRLDIYNGDPNSGGILLAAGYVPVDIPPGGSSGYYGNDFVFPISGYFDIYGVADFYDEIEELNEDNNQAYRTLHVIPSAVAAATTSGADDLVKEPFFASRPRGRELLLPLPVEVKAVTRSPHATEPRTAGLPHGSGGHRRAATAESDAFAGARDPHSTPRGRARATTIAEVATGNHTSSSAAIVWLTDGPADGCVNYGTTTGLGHTECEVGPARTVHMVVLDGLQDETLYYFEVVSGGSIDDNAGSYYTFSTTASGAGIPYVIYGHVDLLGSGAVEGVAVTATLRHGGETSYPLVGLTDSDGVWVLNLGNAKSTASNDVLAFDVGDSLHLEVEGAVSGMSPQDCGTLEIPSTGVDEPIDPIPPSYYLTAGHPNPFSERTTIGFGLPVDAHVDLCVYDVAGRKVATLVDREYPAGHHAVTWSGRNAAGQRVSSGVYFYRLKSGEFEQSGKVFVLK